ncbi:MAG TPA: hypothetical protein VJ499_15485, partial [Flavisolibacter sp.]|nr:hypothetical protein [Flavisolibacter sp.]
MPAPGRGANRHKYLRLLNVHLILFCFITVTCYGQADTSGIESLSKITVMKEIVIRNDLNVANFLRRVKNDSSFYKAFKNLHLVGYTSINDIRMIDKNAKIIASLNSKTKQHRFNNCREMEVLQEQRNGDIMGYFTAELYSSLFFTSGRICNETNIVNGVKRSVKEKSGIEKHKEQLKMLFFDPGKKIPGIPFIGDKVDIFDPELSRYYNYVMDIGEMNGQNCYVFSIKAKDELSSSQRDRIVFDDITTWFNVKTMEIVARNYDLSYSTPVYDFNVHMEVQMTKFGELLLPQVLRYNGNWKVL